MMVGFDHLGHEFSMKSHALINQCSPRFQFDTHLVQVLTFDLLPASYFSENRVQSSKKHINSSTLTKCHPCMKT